MNYHLDTSSREPSGQDPLGIPKGDACNKQEQGHQESGRTAAEGEGRPEDLSIPAKRGCSGHRARLSANGAQEAKGTKRKIDRHDGRPII